MLRKYLKVTGFVCIALLVVILITQRAAVYRGYRTYDHTPSCLIENNNSIQYQQYRVPDVSSIGYSALTLEVNDFARSFTELNAIVSRHGGRNISWTSYQPDRRTVVGTLIVEVPSYLQQTILNQIRGMGRGHIALEEQWAPAYDHVRSVPAQLTNVGALNAQRDALLLAYAKERDPEVSKNIEWQLSNLTANIQSTEVMRDYHPQPVEVATISVTIRARSCSIVGLIAQDCLYSLKNVSKAVVMFVGGCVSAVIDIIVYLVPFIVWVLVIGGMIYMTVRVFKRVF